MPMLAAAALSAVPWPLCTRASGSCPVDSARRRSTTASAHNPVYVTQFVMDYKLQSKIMNASP